MSRLCNIVTSDGIDDVDEDGISKITKSASEFNPFKS